MRWDMEGIEEEKELTEAIRPVAEAAATARLDCRRAFLNIVIEGFRGGYSGREREVDWGKREGKEKRGEGGERRSRREGCGWMEGRERAWRFCQNWR